jgi:phenylalanyl-tRNA synthetase beta chain
MKVALAGIGAKVKWHGEGELVELKPVEIRGVPSEGMICGADEIGLLELFPKKEEKEIVDLTHLTAKPGTALAVALGLDDVVFEIDNKSLSNRPDLWGHYGIAREVAALFGKSLKPYQAKNIKTREHKNTKALSLMVEVEDKKLCPRYMAVAVNGISVGDSPEWMQTKLRAAGVRPVNVLVDITNYVMMEVGQPMHVFDADRLHKNMKALKNESGIVVRRAKEGEMLKALDGKEYKLTTDMLVIADTEKPLAIAGVMGGEASGVTGETASVIFEAATFDSVSIRKTSTALGLRSDSSARFEKSLPPEHAEIALKKAVELTLALVPGSRVASVVVDKKVPVKKRAPIVIPFALLSKKLGISVKTKEISTILTHLGFSVRASKAAHTITVPAWRAKDIQKRLKHLDD